MVQDRHPLVDYENPYLRTPRVFVILMSSREEDLRQLDEWAAKQQVPQDPWTALPQSGTLLSFFFFKTSFRILSTE